MKLREFLARLYVIVGLQEKLKRMAIKTFKQDSANFVLAWSGRLSAVDGLL